VEVSDQERARRAATKKPRSQDTPEAVVEKRDKF
jgi:hypothetical protein